MGNYLWENKINFSLSKARLDLCAVIYRKWLEAGERE